MTDFDRLEHEMLASLRAELKPKLGDRRRVGEALARELGLPALAIVPSEALDELARAGENGLTHGAATANGYVHGLAPQLGVALVKLGLAGLLLAGVGVLGTLALGDAKVPRAPSNPSARDSLAHEVPQVSAPVDAPNTNVRGVVGSDAQGESEAQGESNTPRVVKASPKSKTSSDSELDEELRLLRLAHRANARSDPMTALKIVDQVAARFPNGRLGEERRAVRVIATCKAGGASAEREARGFLARYPTSVYRGRVKAACR